MSAPDLIAFIEEELRLARIELNTITGEMLEAQDKKAKLTGWRDARERCRKRIGRLEKFLGEMRPPSHEATARQGGQS